MQDRPGGQRRSRFEDRPLRNSILAIAAIMYLFLLAYVSAQLDAPARQLVFVIGIGLGALAPKLLRASR